MNMRQGPDNEAAEIQIPECLLCRHCSLITTADLVGPERKDFESSEAYEDEAAARCWFGPPIQQLAINKESCQLCYAVYESLQTTGRLDGDPTRRSVLRLVNTAGHISDGRSPWRAYLMPLDRQRSGTGMAGLGIDVESHPNGGDFPMIASDGLKVVAPRCRVS